jgi:glutaredoxin
MRRRSNSSSTILFLVVIIFASAFAYQFFKVGEGMTTTSLSSIQSGTKVVAFVTDTCTYCKQFKETLNKEPSLSSKITLFDCTSPAPATQTYLTKIGITSYPTIVCMTGGSITNTFTGQRNKQELTDFIQSCGTASS